MSDGTEIEVLEKVVAQANAMRAALKVVAMFFDLPTIEMLLPESSLAVRREIKRKSGLELADFAQETAALDWWNWGTDWTELEPEVFERYHNGELTYDEAMNILSFEPDPDWFWSQYSDWQKGEGDYGP